MSKILQLRKDTSTEVGKMHLYLDGLKQEGVKIFNKLFKQVDSKANSSHKELVILVQKSYSNFFKNMERSYERFRHNIHNILT